MVVGQTVEDLMADMRSFTRSLTNDSQLRWLGPEKGVIHLAAAAIINAVWDLSAKQHQKPLWKLLADMPAQRLVDSVDFRYVTDFLTPDEAVEMLERTISTQAAREQEMLTRGYPAYTTSAGWYGYSEAQMRQLVRQGMAAGWTHFKIKVGGDLSTDVQRVGAVREEIGPARHLMLDANQVWDIPDAIAAIHALSRFDMEWMEEPTSPDDVVGYQTIARAVAPTGLAGGEHVQNRIIFKQLFQLNALACCQVDACRLGGVNEVLAVMWMAQKAGVPVCPHAGGVGLPEYVQHLAIFDYVRVSGSLERRTLEYVDHLHEHFVHPVQIRDGHYVAPRDAGYSATMRPESLSAYRFPDGPIWRALLPQ
jgi:L-fuconate dehydratase